MKFSISYFKDLKDIHNIEDFQSIEDLEKQEDAFILASEYSEKGNNVIIFEGNVVKDYLRAKVVAMYEPLDSNFSEILKPILRKQI